MRALFWSVQLLDGVETTRDHAPGRLAELLTSGGLTAVVIHRRFATPAGSLGLLSARPGPPTVPVTKRPPSPAAHTTPRAGSSSGMCEFSGTTPPNPRPTAVAQVSPRDTLPHLQTNRRH